MKKIALLLLFAVILSACVTPPQGGDPEAQRELDSLMEHWINALKTENIDAYMEVYWPDAERVILQPDGGEIILRGIGEIREQQTDSFMRLDGFEDLHYSEPEREFHGETAAYHYEVESPQVFFRQHFEFQHREGRWAIIHQVIDLRTVGEVSRAEGFAEDMEPPKVASEFQAWADGNRNGILERPELEEFLEAVRVLIQAPHPLRSPADEFFDLERDGEIDHREMIEARGFIFLEQLRKIYRYDPNIARLFDFNGDEWISIWEIAPIKDILFIPEFREPREARGHLERRIDRNRDGFADEEEFDQFARRIFVVAALLPLPPIEGYMSAASKEGVFAYVDLNENNRLEPLEEGDLVFVVQEMVTSTPGRPVQSPLEAFFDRNRDGYLAFPEIEQARIEFTEAAIARLFEAEPEVARNYIDTDRNNRIDDEEVELVLGRVFADPEFREPHPVRGPLDERLDRNRDGHIDVEEMGDFFHRVVRVAALTWLEAPEQRQERWPVRSALDKLTDLNGDGFIEPAENEMAMGALEEPHRVESEFDRRIDFNGNGRIEEIEIIRARRAGNVITEEREPLTRSLPVATPVDKLLDLNGDNQVHEEEIQVIIQFLQQPERPIAPGRWWSLLDFDNNGVVSSEELLTGWEMYLRPHPVNPDFHLDGKLDANSNGFVEPQEIGIAAGFTRGRPIPTFEERLEQLGWRAEQDAEAAGTSEETRFESEYYKKLGMVQDKKLAVVGINSGTKNVDDETASGVMVFIENAFVNVGKVRVVDRQNIAKIVSEYEFQQSDLTDESTAVEIGKLSGADIIVIGSISYVGKLYYLNIKLISVETGEIIGSSIDKAEDAAGFYEMCNQAVYKLF
jgi:Ca2+-binding EF-hand superfamily protein/PBP1b-binding outer membrane lipoprotein LpoB